MCFRLHEDSSRPFLNILWTFCEQSKIAEDRYDKMRRVSKKYANSSKYNINDTDFFSTETITLPTGFRMFAIAQVSLSLAIGKLFG